MILVKGDIEGHWPVSVGFINPFILQIINVTTIYPQYILLL